MGSIISIIGCLGSLVFIVIVIVVIFILLKKKKPEGQLATKEVKEIIEETPMGIQAEAKPVEEVVPVEETLSGEAVTPEGGISGSLETEETPLDIWGSLIIEDAPDNEFIGTEYQIAGNAIIGRSPDADISCEFDKAMSRQHSEVFMGPEGHIMIRDVGSSNGTIINGQPIAEATKLEEGMEILLGETTFKWKA
jgi:hypothetical protein